MFRESKIETLDLSSFHTPKVTNMDGTFRATVVTKVLVKNEEDLEKYKNSGSVLALTKFYVKS